jgi:hypothetical protein
MSGDQKLRFDNGFELELALDGDRFLGIGEVLFAGTALRSSQLPWTLYTESERGYRFENFKLVEVSQDGQKASIAFESQGSWMPRVQEADSMGDSRIRAPRLKAPTATFTWSFRAISEQIADDAWTGLAMQVEVKTPDYPIHWVLEDTTWEIGGSADGSTTIQQDLSAIDLEQTVTSDNRFTTRECFIRDEDMKAPEDPVGFPPGCYPMDMMPRGAGASPLDFVTKDDLAIILFSEAPGMSRACMDKYADEDIIHFLDRPFFALTEAAKLPERKLLVHRHDAVLKRHEWRNLWLDAFSEVRQRIHRTYGFSLEIPRPAVAGHLWDPQFHDYGKKWHDAAINAFPVFQRLGYSGFYTHGVWEGATSDPDAHGNICTPYAFRHDDMFGGPEGMKRLVDAAREAGIDVFHWAGFQYSKSSPAWKDHEDWILKKANGEAWDAGYKILQCGRMRSAFRDHIFKQLKQTREETGMTGLFWDSYQNLGATCIDWGAPDMAPQFEEIIRFQAELQSIGYQHRTECISIFGVSQVGMYSFEGDDFRRRLWETMVANDEAFGMMDASPAFHSHDHAYAPGKVGPEEYFWLVAHRVVPTLEVYPWAGDWDDEKPGWGWPGREHAEAYGDVNHLYNAVLPHMQRLRLTEGGNYALWLDAAGNEAVLWCFRDSEHAYAGDAIQVSSGEKQSVSGSLSMKAGQVYVLGDAATRCEADATVPAGAPVEA